MIDHISEVRFIKLGGGGKWEKDCIDSGTIRFGFDNPYHEECVAGDWEPLEKFWRTQKRPAEATKIVNQTKDFYTLDENALWITFMIANSIGVLLTQR